MQAELINNMAQAYDSFARRGALAQLELQACPDLALKGLLDMHRIVFLGF